MSKLTLNFFGDEVSIPFPKNLKSLRINMVQKFLFDASDVEEIQIYYLNSNKEKVFIESNSDFLKFQQQKINTLYLDINQESKLYTENKKELEKEQLQKQLVELLVLYNEKKQKKKKDDIDNKKISDSYTKKIQELQNLQKKFIEQKEKHDKEYLNESKNLKKKIYNIQKKLNIPQNLNLPTACPSTEIILRNKKKKNSIKQNNLYYSSNIIAISFDDGPVSSVQSSTSMRIINALANNGFKATFFYVSNWINGTDGENEIKYAYQKGMEIANHTKTHPYLTNLSYAAVKDEADTCYNRLKSIISAEPSKLLRLPYLASNDIVKSALSGYGLITCSIDSQDWNNATKDNIVYTIKNAINNGTADGAIVLCHETYQTTAAAIEELAPYLKSIGWKIDTISNMFSAKGKSIKYGDINTNA